MQLLSAQKHATRLEAQLEGIVAGGEAAARAQAQETTTVVAREKEAVARCEQLQAHVRKLDRTLAAEGAEHVKVIEEIDGKYRELSYAKVCTLCVNIHAYIYYIIFFLDILTS